MRCESLPGELSYHTQLAVQAYNELSNQLLVSGMGTVLGINHLVVHEYLRMMQFHGLEYRFLFHKINQLSVLARTASDKYQKDPQTKKQPITT